MMLNPAGGVAMRRPGLVAVALLVVAVLVAAPRLRADEPKGTRVTAEEFEAQLGYQTGTVTIADGLATLRLPESFRFIGPEASKRLLTDAWGNPPAASEGVLGMLIPAGVSPLTAEGWGIVISFDADGFVNDADAATIDYDKMMKEMQASEAADNESRKKAGFGSAHLVGWAEPPSYDRATHKLYWAKELAFEGSENHTLNYNIRILGRAGVLVLNAVSGMDRLAVIRGETQGVLAAVEFNEGHRYTDYLPGKDKAATYGVAGLIAGAVAAKAGLFKLLWVGILAFKKVILVGIVGLGAWIRRLFTGRSDPTASAAAGGAASGGATDATTPS
jgi:uncharacterized membrane-anchored protein